MQARIIVQSLQITEHRMPTLRVVTEEVSVYRGHKSRVDFVYHPGDALTEDPFGLEWYRNETDALASTSRLRANLPISIIHPRIPNRQKLLQNGHIELDIPEIFPYDRLIGKLLIGFAGNTIERIGDPDVQEPTLTQLRPTRRVYSNWRGR